MRLRFLAVFAGTLACLAEPCRSQSQNPLFIADQLAGIGLPYLWGGADPADGGLDCSGFVKAVFQRAYGLCLPDESGKQYEWLSRHGRVWNAATGWSPSDLQAGDLIFWSGTSPSERASPITHVMMYAGHNRMVGAQSAGRQIGGKTAGVGYFFFQPGAPAGNPSFDPPRSPAKPTLYAYGRIPSQGSLFSSTLP
jgi:hypothetical protein